MIFKKIKIFGLIISLCTLSGLNAYSQNTFRISYDVDPLYDMPGGIVESTTGNYVFGGGLLVGGITEIDPTGIVNWSELYSEGTTVFSDLVNVNTGYAVAGNSGNDLLLAEASSTGVITWGQKYRTINGSNEYAAQVKRLANGDYIIAGSVEGFDPDGGGVMPVQDSANFYIIKTNSTGTVLWDKIILPTTTFDNDNYLRDVAEVTGGYIFVGSIAEDGTTDNTDCVILKTDINGNLLWMKKFGEPGVSDGFESVNKLASGQVLIAGFINESVFMMRIDANGNDTWKSGYNDPTLLTVLDNTVGYNAFETSDGKYACVGTYIDPLTLVAGINGGNLPMMGTFLIKVEPSTGAIIFQKFFQNGLSALMPDGIQTSDNGYLLTMMAQEMAPLTGFNYHTVKTDINGNVGSTCDVFPINLATSGYTPSYVTVIPTTYTGTITTAFSPLLNTPTPAVGAICCSVSDPTSATATPNTVCAGTPAVITASGSAPGVTYNVYDASGTTLLGTAPLTVTPTASTTYMVEAESSIGCISQNMIPVIVTVTTAPSVSVDLPTATICQGDNISVTASGTGGTGGPYTYLWSTGVTTGALTISPPSTTMYTVTTSDGVCSSTSTSSVITVVPPITASITGGTSSCNNEMITLIANPSGGTYLWGTGETTQAITVNPQTTTTYSVGVTLGACFNNATQGITVLTPPVATITGFSSVCAGSGITLTAGPNGNAFSWSTAETTSNILVSPTTNTTYTLVSTASNGCSDTTQRAVTVNSLPTVVANVSPNANVCAGDQITLTGSGATSYAWSNGAINNTPFAPSSITYTVTGTDANGCQNTDIIAVTVNSLPTVVANVSPNTVVCAGDLVTLTGSGANTYTWDNGVTDNTPFVPSSITYTVTGTDANGCQNTDIIAVTVNSLPTVVANVSPNTVVCAGDLVTLTGSGSNTYTWDNGAINNTPFVPSSITYTVTGTDANGCQNTDVIAITVNTLPIISLAGTTTICEGSNSALTVSGANTYSWSPATNLSATTGAVVTASPIANITYTVIGTDANNCVNSSTVLIIVNPAPIVVANVSPSSTICTGSTITLSGSGAVSYTWDNGAMDGSAFVPTGTTLYTITGTDGVGCTNVDTITINVVPPPIAIINGAPNSTITVCSNETTSLTVSPSGGTYSWSTGETAATINVMPTSTITYTATVTIGSCSDFTDIIITVNTSPTGVVSGTGNNLVCTGTNDTLTASGGSTYLWNTTETTPSIVITPVSTTNYTVIVYDTNLCTDTLNYNVSVNPLPTISITGTDTICSGSSITLTGNGGISYVWSTTETTQSISVSPTLNTTYSVTGTDANGCENTNQVSIVAMAPPSAGITGNTTTCTGQSVVLTAAGGNSYIWSTGETVEQVSVNPGTTTTYTVVALVGTCADTATYTVNVTSPPNVTIGADTSIIIGQSFTLNATGATEYSWITPNDNLDCLNCSDPIASPDVSITYCVVGDQLGCLDTVCINVEVVVDCGEIFVPNAFSPNGDNNNDCLRIYSNCLETMTLQIYARWGELVFETSDIEGCWDGTYKGQALNTATFAFILEYTLIDGTSDVLKGNVSLIK